MTRHDDDLYLRHMLESAVKAQAFIQGKSRADYEADEVLRLALAHLLQVIGEAARKVPEPRQAAHPEIPWKAVMGMRHRIVHNYADVDEALIWQTVIEDLPPLILALKAALADEEQGK
jgi:uncharacterized protein with HEPN domain